MSAAQNQSTCMAVKITDVARTKLRYVIFQFVLLPTTISYLTKH